MRRPARLGRDAVVTAWQPPSPTRPLGSFLCQCGLILTLEVGETDSVWRFQHGPNPEHALVSRDWQRRSAGEEILGRPEGAEPILPADIEITVYWFIGARADVRGTWIDAVHARMEPKA